MAKSRMTTRLLAAIGVPLAIAYILYSFAIGPYIAPGYPLTLQTVLAFSNPLAVFVFLGLWALLASGWTTGAIILGRRSK